MIQLNVECYGGGLWHTWFDRDLSIAGRVILRRSGGVLEHRLLKIDRSILRIPNLCIHLQSGAEREAFAVNKENHLMPVLCNEVQSVLGNQDGSDEARPVKKAKPDQGNSWQAGQQPELLELLADELSCSVADIADFELSLYDTQGAALSGSRSEFLCSSRLDNLASCFTAVEALEAHATDSLAEDEDVSVIALFDHEEVGSSSFSGAGSTLIGDAVERISFALAEDQSQNIELHKAARQR
jgi:aspartyl aminopeptidase